MHLVQEYISNPVVTGSYIISTCVAGTCLFKLVQQKTDKSYASKNQPSFVICLFAIFGVIALHQLNYDCFHGYSGHLLGASLLVYYLGFLRTSLIMLSSLFLQSVLLGDGDLLSLGANTLTMGIVIPGVMTFFLRKRQNYLWLGSGIFLSLYAGVSAMAMMTVWSGTTSTALVGGALLSYLSIALIESVMTLSVVILLENKDKLYSSKLFSKPSVSIAMIGLFILLLSMSSQEYDVLSSFVTAR